jgi:hypothetical protein
MLSLSRTRLPLGLAFLAAALLPVSRLQAQAGKNITFETYDGVKISGTLHVSPTPKREAVVMLLHTFDRKKGGSSQQDGWAGLTKDRLADGYHVLSFDFRGFGDSKTVTDRFWNPKYSHNLNLIVGGAAAAARKSDTIDHGKFTVGYMPYLINDIAAAKAYIDRRNDAGQLNASNVILIGAGEGAALGALWLKNECRRKRDTNIPPIGLPTLTPHTEINDIACAVWLSVRPGFNNRVSSSVSSAIRELADKRNKVPMAFVYGKNDKQAANLSENYYSLIKGKGTEKMKGFTGTHAIERTSLSGNQLLGVDGTRKWIIEKYLDPVMTARGNREQKDRKSEASQYWYVYPNGRTYKVSKIAGRESPEVDLGIVFQ